MNIKRIAWIVYGLILMGSISCYDDKGHYDYKLVEQSMVIDGIDKGYSKAVGDVLEIIPTIVNYGDPVGDTARYEYWWTAQRELYREGVNNTQYVIGHGPSLYYQVDLPNISPDMYLIVFHMKDKKTEIEWTEMTNLTITGSLQKGWLLLTDKGGNAELNMYAQKSDGKMVLVKNILSKSGFPYTQGPRKIMYEKNMNTADGNKIWILTDAGAGWLTKEDYQWAEDQMMKYKMVEPVGDGYTCRNMQQYGMVIFQLEDEAYRGGFQAVNWQNLGAVYAGNVAVYDKGTSNFTVEPYVGGNYTNPMVAGGILYDRDNERFVYCAVTNSALPEECVRLSDKPDWQVDMKMLYMQSTISQDRIFALFENEGTDDVWQYELQLTIGISFVGGVPVMESKPVFNKRELLENAPHLKNARFRTYQMTKGYLYYIDGNTLYTWYDGAEHQIMTFSDEVTALHCQYVDGDPASSEYILVATYSDNSEIAEEERGDLYFYTTDGAASVNIAQRNHLKGVGKIVDIDYQLK